MGRQVLFTIQNDDAMSYTADVLALKYAGTFYGVDHAVANRLVNAGLATDLNDLRARSGFKIVSSGGLVAAQQVMFVSAPRPREFTYAAVRELAVTMLYQLKYAFKPTPRTMATTVHGIGFGLDELEIITSQVAGFMEAFRNNDFPETLETISIVELDPRRVERLRATVDALLAKEPSAVAVTGEQWGWAIDVDALRGIVANDGKRAVQAERTARPEKKTAAEPAPEAPKPAIVGPTAAEKEAARAEAKKHIFVAMPFRAEYEDLWEFGIYTPIREMDLQSARIDQETFTGDIFDQIKFRIETAAAVVAVLDSYNPNVFLELGYAMGKNIPTILLVHRSMIDEKKLPFDIQSQRCIGYTNIKDCKKLLTTELTRFRAEKML